MKDTTLAAIMRRHVWYMELLKRRMAEWPEERVATCRDLRELAYVIKLTERVERHYARMDRFGPHVDRMLASMPTAGGVQ